MCRHNNNKMRASGPPPETEKTEPSQPGQVGDDPKKTSQNLNHLEPSHNHGRSQSRSHPLASLRRQKSEKVHSCDQCNRQFLYDYSLRRHIRSDHLHKETILEPYSSFGYFGKVKKPDKKPRRIKGEIREVIVANEKLKIVAMNVFSLVPVEKKLFVRNGILDSGADVVAISESKF